MKNTIQKFVVLLVVVAQLGIPAHAIDDARLVEGDQLPYQDIPASLPKSELAVPTQVEMGGFVFDNLHGKGPERDDQAVVANARQMEREPEPNQLIKVRKKTKIAPPKVITRQVASKSKKSTKRKAYEMRLKAQFWSVTSLSGIWFISNAEARPLSSTERNSIRFQAQQRLGRPVTEQELDTIIGAMGGNQGGDQGGDQGGEGGGGGGSSGGASETLFAVAAIIAAASPAVVAAIQAGADKSIAQTNANAQVAMTAMASETSMYLADTQAEVAITQTLVARDISKNNQESETERLGMQLASLADAQRTSSELDLWKARWQFQMDMTRIQIAKEQADATTKLAQMQLRLQLSIAGMTGGAGTSSLTVTRRSGGYLNPSFYSGKFARVQSANTSLASGKLLANVNPTTTKRPAMNATNSRRGVEIDTTLGGQPLVTERVSGNPWDAAYNARLQRSLASEISYPAPRRNMTPLSGDATSDESGPVMQPNSRHKQRGASSLDAGLQ